MKFNFLVTNRGLMQGNLRLEWAKTGFYCLGFIVLLLPHSLVHSLRAQSPQAASAKPNPPNLILILADDLGYADIGPYGSTKNRTPHLDRMAQEGMKLTSFYGCPVCTPSRAQLMTGCYAKRVSLPNVLFPTAPVGLHQDEVTIAGLLKSQGYRTGCIGKWHLGDQPEFLPTRRGFDHYFGLPYSNDMGPRGPSGRGVPLPLLRGEKVIETVSNDAQADLTARYTDEAVQFIQGHKDQPFFLYLPHTAVHDPYHPGKSFQGKSKNGVYGDWVEELDWSVGRILDKLRKTKLDSNTLVIFSSDNGGTQRGNNQPLRGFKFTTWEGGMREPTIAWWPGKISPSSSFDEAVGTIDILPTFVKIAGGTVPPLPKRDGKDLSPILLGQSKAPPHDAYFYFRGNALEGIRSGNWKYFINEETLHDLETDIGESVDLSADFPEIVKKMKDYAAQMDADLGVKANKPGPGVRPSGKVANPKPLLLKK